MIIAVRRRDAGTRAWVGVGQSYKIAARYQLLRMLILQSRWRYLTETRKFFSLIRPELRPMGMTSRL
jgi:hypothetical protein